MTREEIEQEGLADVVPTRDNINRCTVNILVSGNDKEGKWHPAAAEPTEEQKKRLVAIVVSLGVKVVMESHTFMVGDTIYRQTHGGAIGLELTMEVSRLLMMEWDRLFMEKMASLEMPLPLAGRYVDDHNDAVQQEDGEDEETTAAKVKEVADSLLPGIVMENDIPSRHEDNKIAVLDMKVWQLESGDIVHEHYVKPSSTDHLVPARSAHPGVTKRSMHVEGCVRIMDNCSRLLKWEDYAVPHLNNYMRRMKQDGYSEEYRRGVLKAALDRNDAKLAADRSGERPLNRPPGYQREARRKAKKAKKRNWASSGGYVAPVIVPCTPNSVLARRMRAANPEKDPKLRLRVVEWGGVPIGKMIMGNTNPAKSANCFRPDCGVCASGGKRCSVSGVTYRYVCQKESTVGGSDNGTAQRHSEGNSTDVTEEPEVVKCGAEYLGETSKNMYSRHLWHQEKYDKKSSDSFMANHMSEKHNGEPAEFKIVVMDKFKDAMSRQLSEALKIKNQAGKSEILNSKAEYHQPQIVRLRKSVQVGL